jgi:hypothetical protein
MAREGVPLLVIQRQLGHTNLGSTCRASTAPRSSIPSTPAAHRWPPSTPHSDPEPRIRPSSNQALPR